MNKFQQILLFILLFFVVISCNDKNSNYSDEDRQITEMLDQVSATDNDSVKKQLLESVYQKINDYPYKDSIPRYYLMLTEAYYNSSNYQGALKIGKQSVELNKEIKDTVNVAQSLYTIGNTYYFGLADTDSAYIFYTQAEKLFQESHQYRSLGKTKLYKAYVLYYLKEYQLCETEAFRALGLLQGRDATDIYNCHNLIAAALDGQGLHVEAIKYYELALRQLLSFNKEDSNDIDVNYYKSTCYNNLGNVYLNMEDYAKAEEFYLNALKLTSKESNPSLYAKLLNSLAYARFKSGNEKDLPKMFYEALAIRDSLGISYGIVATKKYLGEYYAAKKDTAKAVEYLREAYSKAENIKGYYDVVNTLKLLGEIDKPQSATYYKRLNVVNDSLQKVEQANKDKFARIEYETERLEDEKEALVKRNGFIIGVSAMVLLFIGAVFIIYYLNSRNKKLVMEQEQQKANEEIYQLMFEQQTKIDKARAEEKSRIAMELHDGILNNIYAVRLNLEFINRNTDEESVAQRKEYIKQLQTVESEIRGVSHDLSRNAVFFEKSFKDVIESLVLTQKNEFNTIFDVDIDVNINWENLPNIQKVNVYRVIQEGLQNINKYSVAHNAIVEIKKDHEAIELTITDDGIGYDPDKVKGGIGLRNLKKRTSVLNGKLDIISAPGKGAKIHIVFPN